MKLSDSLLVGGAIMKSKVVMRVTMIEAITLRRLKMI